jgi:hypothetical protein
MTFAQMHGHATSTRFIEDNLRISPCAKFLFFAPAVRQDEFLKVSWPVVKSNSEEALRFFSQGMTQYYGLNYEEAMRNFKGAKVADKTMAMASWGIALAAGSNINLTMDDSCHKLAKAEMDCALSLAGEGPQTKGCEKGASITAVELELIKALNKRYDYKVGDKAAGEIHAQQYSDAMAVLWKQNQKDQNVGALYAESMMNMHAWDLYEHNGDPKPWTPAIVKVLGDSIGKPPDAVGPNHYYIHGIEGSTDPKRAEPSANLLQTRVEKSGHLVHMSSHIYLLLGQYKNSLDANMKGAGNDVDQYGEACHGTYEMYTRNDKCPELYYGHYLSHNYFFGSVSSTFLGRSEQAMDLACDTSAHVKRFVIYEPGLQRYLTAPLMTMVVNRNWEAVCTETKCKEPDVKPPDFEDCYLQGPFTEDAASGCHILRSIWYWARGMANATRGDWKSAGTDSEHMADEMGQAQTHEPVTWGNNLAVTTTLDGRSRQGVLNIGRLILGARIQWAQVERFGADSVVRVLKPAVTAEDKLSYDEPPQWFTPTREALGGLYLQARQYSNALGVFEDELSHHPASGRAIYGKIRALQGLHVSEETVKKIIDQEFCPAWQYADYKMTDADLWPPMSNEPASDDENMLKIVCPANKNALKPKPSEKSCMTTPWPPS